jgi:hypothetical protein
MRKISLLFLFTILYTLAAFSQADKFWSVATKAKSTMVTEKAVARLTFPKEFKLFYLNVDLLKQELLRAAGNKLVKQSMIISLPNMEGNIEKFEVSEASNFDTKLQAEFPEIRAYSGKGITDRYATLKMSLSPEGIQTMIFRTDQENEFIEPYSKDHTVYAVFKSNREKNKLPWTCSTSESFYAADLAAQLPVISAAGTSTGQVKTLRLAQSCNGEYANWFGATNIADVAKVLAAFNATLTRCNGVYEKDLALHLNLISATTNVIYYNPSTDPYTTLANWNSQLMNTLHTIIGDTAFDIGHMFGASGGGGNAGCIGCICSNTLATGVSANSSTANYKGSGITSPADGIPQGDNFDIDYVVHEMGHQLGANHTFSMSLEGTGVNKEVGSGITIMGYAGITSQDVAPHSIDIYHEASIAQIQANLAAKTCPVSAAMTGNTAPSIAPLNNYTIPISTPFVLTGTATDAESDALTYCWEQDDNSTTSGTGSVASPTKTTGPNWLSFSPTASGTRLFPKLSTILAGLNVTPPLTGGDAGTNIEALSSVARTLNFRLTVRDNSVYVPGIKAGQTAFSDAVITVSSAAGPFAVTAPNTSTIIWDAGSTATVTWSVNNTNATPINCSSVNILLSTDGGQTFPTVLAAATANDGTEVITVPSSLSTACRIKVESVGNIFFDISNADFTIGTPPPCSYATGLTTSAITSTTATVSWTATANAASYDADYKLTSSSVWTNAATATTNTSFNLTGLTAGTSYDWRVRVNCTAGIGNYTYAQFTTSAPTCPGPYDVSTNGTTSGAAAIPLNTDVLGKIDVSNDNDYYKFTITTGGTITMTLTTLPANYQLAILNNSGSVLQSSTNTGTTSETIGRTVTAGTYYARVYPVNSTTFNASSCYTLKIQTGTAAKEAIAETVLPAFVDKLTVSPNPAKTSAKIAFNTITDGNASITITSQTGAVMLKQIFAASKGTNVKNIDINSFSAGVYFIKVNTRDKVETARIVVVK